MLYKWHHQNVRICAGGYAVGGLLLVANHMDNITILTTDMPENKRSARNMLKGSKMTVDYVMHADIPNKR
jgi:hypothetical protein